MLLQPDGSPRHCPYESGASAGHGHSAAYGTLRKRSRGITFGKTALLLVLLCSYSSVCNISCIDGIHVELAGDIKSNTTQGKAIAQLSSISPDAQSGTRRQLLQLSVADQIASSGLRTLVNDTQAAPFNSVGLLRVWRNDGSLLQVGSCPCMAQQY